LTVRFDRASFVFREQTKEGKMRNSSVSRLGLAASLVATFLLAATAPAFAGTLDQQQTESDSNTGLFVNQNPAQTFTAGVTGVLDRADLLLGGKDGSPVEPLTVEIRNTSAGEPGTSVLASTSIPMSAVGIDPAFVPATFGTPAAVMAGTQYALVAYTAHPTNDCCGWSYQDATDPYSGGEQFVSPEPPPGENWFAFSTRDFAFKTYVGPPPPPSTPSTPPTTAPTTQHKKKCKKHKKHRSAESAKKKCKKKKHR
jgi:hypothetical protein